MRDIIRVRCIVLFVGIGFVLWSDYFLLPNLKNNMITHRIFKIIRNIVYIITFIFMLSNEIQTLYCDGHTVISCLLTSIAKKLMEYSRHGLAFPLLRMALYWNQLWLPKSSKLLLSNYSDLALVSGLLNKHRLFHNYTKYLANLKLKHSKHGLTGRWNKIMAWVKFRNKQF